jgi:hypothetical protein
MYYAVKCAKMAPADSVELMVYHESSRYRLAEGGLYKDLTDGPSHRMLRDDLPMKRSTYRALTAGRLRAEKGLSIATDTSWTLAIRRRRPIRDKSAFTIPPIILTFPGDPDG